MATPDYLNMSDEELLNAAPPSAADVAAAAADPQANEVDAGGEKDEDEEGAAGAAEKAAGDAAADAGTAAAQGDDADDKAGEKAEGEAKGEAAAEGGTPEAGAKPGAAAEDAGEKQEEKDPKEAKPAADQAAVTDFEAEYKKLLAPFKANGKDIQVQSVDEAVALMQMGANYNKKMAALKPNLKLLKMLEKADLLSEERIGFLIDLGRKDPAAINKLVKDSGIDPLDLTAEKAEAYKQSSYAVDDREVELDTVLEEIQDSPAYTQTLELVSNKWDPASKRIVAQQPQLLKVINDHMASGIYDLISTEVERERVFGRLTGLSDIEAYRQVGDAIHARGGFNHLAQAKKDEKPAAGEIVQPKPKKVDDGERNDKRRAASTTTPTTPPATGKADFNPLSLSDKEFEKLINQRLA